MSNFDLRQAHSNCLFLARTTDMYTVDEELVMTLRMYIRNLTQIFSTVLVISGVSPVFTACLIPIFLFYVKEQAFFTVSPVVCMEQNFAELSLSHTCLPFTSKRLLIAS